MQSPDPLYSLINFVIVCFVLFLLLCRWGLNCVFLSDNKQHSFHHHHSICKTNIVPHFHSCSYQNDAHLQSGAVVRTISGLRDGGSPINWRTWPTVPGMNKNEGSLDCFETTSSCNYCKYYCRIQTTPLGCTVGLFKIIFKYLSIGFVQVVLGAAAQLQGKTKQMKKINYII